MPLVDRSKSVPRIVEFRNRNRRDVDRSDRQAPFQGVEGIGMLAEAWHESMHVICSLPKIIHYSLCRHFALTSYSLDMCSVTCSLVLLFLFVSQNILVYL